MAGRPALSEVEITPEMIDAGVDRLLDYSINFDDPSEVVRQVLASCLSAASVIERNSDRVIGSGRHLRDTKCR